MKCNWIIFFVLLISVCVTCLIYFLASSEYVYHDDENGFAQNLQQALLSAFPALKREGDNININKYGLFEVNNFTTNAIENFNYSNFAHINKSGINSYTLDSSKNYRTLDDFNNELFCPLQMSITSTNSTNNTQQQQLKYNKYEKLLKDIFRLQFPGDCTINNNSDTKFYIVDQSCVSGLFAFLHCFAGHMYRAITKNRTFIFNTLYNKNYTIKKHEKNSMIAFSEYCNNKGDECLFLPLTNCSIIDEKTGYNLIKHAKLENEYFLKTPQSIHKIHQLNESTLKQQMKEKMRNIKVIHQSGFRRPPIDCYQVKELWPTMSCSQFTTMMFNIFLRIQPSMLNIINKMVYNSLDYYNEGYSFFKPQETISSPVRWTDKCSNNPNRVGRSEQECFTLREYINVFKLLQIIMDNKLSSMIVTSESRQVISQLSNQTLYDPIVDLMNMTLLFNKYDIMQESGSLKYSSNKNPLSVFLSLISSMKLQFAGKYFAFSINSGWSSGIFALKTLFHCKPLYQTQIELLINNGYSNEFISDEKNLSMILNKFKLDNSDKSQQLWNYDTECIRFNSVSRNHKGQFDRYVTFSSNINKIKRRKFVNQQKLQIELENLGIKSRWDKNCVMGKTINDG